MLSLHHISEFIVIAKAHPIRPRSDGVVGKTTQAQEHKVYIGMLYATKTSQYQ